MSSEAFQVFSGMSFLNLEQLPFVGISYEFVGEKQGAPGLGTRRLSLVTAHFCGNVRC
jgi:hypothetical protein